ncbi:MAG TPA: Imm1 family immunity protein [Pseudonocardiaceae bacterium]|jgi:hypothetical protein|nr:Imm1 family immunity protein [Pseudonocardiaceae bacterium]
MTDLARETLIHIDDASMIRQLRALNATRPGEVGFWWDFVGSVTGHSSVWAAGRPTLSIGLRGRLGTVAFGPGPEPDPWEIPVSSGPTNSVDVVYTRVALGLAAERMVVPPGRELPIEQVEAALAHFLDTGEKPPGLAWRTVSVAEVYQDVTGPEPCPIGAEVGQPGSDRR